MNTRHHDFVAACERGDADVVRSRLSADPGLASVTGEHAKTGLHAAAETDQVEVARILVEAGADIEARTSWGATPFDWAATMGSVAVADLLLGHGASGLTLITSAALGKAELVRSLAEGDLSRHRRRDAPAEPDDHWTADSAHVQGDVLSDALYAAARNGHTEVVRDLLGRGARVDGKGVFGAPGLHWAALNGHAETVDLLLEAGADPTIRDARFDATAAGWATEGGHEAIAERIRGHG